jgi:hypothetical protein
MNAREAIRSSIEMSGFISTMYLDGLSDAELLIRPVPGMNHIAWQLGHLIISENQMVEKTVPGSMPALPAGFAEKHTKETAPSDDPKAFCTKDQYVELMQTQRAATLAALAKLSDADLDRDAPEEFREYAKRVADVFNTQSAHWLMHAGQWVAVRRKLGRPAMF